MKLIVTAALVALIAACGSKAPATEAPDPTATTADGDAPAGGGQVATLLSLEQGDRACYVGLRLADGSETSMEGSFDLCPGSAGDASALIGQQVTFTTEKANVLAAECEGDVDCGKSDEVDMVNSITAAP